MGSARALLVYDGGCGFCTSTADWISRRWPDGDVAPTAVPWQKLGPEALAETGLSQEDVKRAAWWISDGQREEGCRAVGRALVAAGNGWAIVGRILLAPPVSWIAPFGYRVVARYRYRLPGGTPACKA